jgi:hypothetical protein
VETGRTNHKPDHSRIDAALRIAGKRALWLGIRLGTPVIVYRNGQIVDAAKTDSEPSLDELEWKEPR